MVRNFVTLRGISPLDARSCSRPPPHRPSSGRHCLLLARCLTHPPCSGAPVLDLPNLHLLPAILKGPSPTPFREQENYVEGANVNNNQQVSQYAAVIVPEQT